MNTFQENIARLEQLAEGSMNVRQKVRIGDSIYLQTKSMLRVYYMNFHGLEKSMEVLSWGPQKVLRKAYALGLLEYDHDCHRDEDDGCPICGGTR